MKKPLVIISACQFTRLALESLIPADRYIVRVYSNVTTEVEFVLKTSCGYLLADIPSLPSGELVLLACLVRLRSDAGQWQVCLTGDSDWFDNAPASSLYNGFPHHSFVVVLCVAPFFLPPDVSISGVLKNLRLLKTGMSVERAISVANASGGFSGLKHAENLPVMDSYSVFMNEVNNRTKTIVMSERFPEKQKKVLSLLLAGHSWEYSAQFLKTGIRQIWLAEQSLKKRWGIPDSMSLREALLLSSNKFHGDGNALEKTNAMTLRENGNTNRYSVVVNAGTQALSLHKYK
ncbi:hypothetical protein ACP51S_002533 [Escherichia coli]